MKFTVDDWLAALAQAETQDRPANVFTRADVERVRGVCPQIANRIIRRELDAGRLRFWGKLKTQNIAGVPCLTPAYEIIASSLSKPALPLKKTCKSARGSRPRR